MEVHIYRIKAKSQAGNVQVKDIITTPKTKAERKSDKDLKNLRILLENLTEGLGTRGECC